MRQARFQILSLASVLLLTLPFCAVAQTTSAAKLYGTWYNYPGGNPITDSLRHQFRHNNATNADEMVVTNSCPTQKKPITARAVSPIEVTDDSIRVLKSSDDLQHGEDDTVCEATINAGIWSYSFDEDGERLTITNPGGNPDILELARGDAPTAKTPAQSLYGSWLLPTLGSKELQMQTRYVFFSTAEHHDMIRQIAVCSKGNDSAVSHVDSEITVTKDSIIVLESATHSQQEGSFICKVTIAPGTWRYTLAPNGLSMTITMNGSKPVTLTREPKPGLN